MDNNQNNDDEVVSGQIIPSPTNSRQLSSNFVEDTTDVKSVIKIAFKNFIGLVPGVGQGVGTIIEYRESKIARIREEKINSCLSKVEERLKNVEIKQEAINYFEDSLMFRFEEIMQKLLTYPNKGFDDVIAEFVVNALTDLQTPPETKDLILSTLINLDSVDILVLQTLDKHFQSNLDPSKTNTGVTRDSMFTLLKDSGIEQSVISRSLQRLQAQYLIQPLNTSTATVQETPSSKELYEGKRSPQFDSPSGFFNTDFGRTFLNFLKLSD